MKLRSILIGTLGLGFVVLSAQWAQGGSLKAQFSNDAAADAFVAAAENNGQGKGATVTRNADGTTSVTLPEVATDSMSETALDAIEEHANAVEIGPPIPDAVKEAIQEWFDGFQAQGQTEIATSDWEDYFEYAGCSGVGGGGTSATGFDRLHGAGNTFFAYLSDPFRVVAEIEDLDPGLEDALRAAIEGEAIDRGITVGAPGSGATEPCPF